MLWSRGDKIRFFLSDGFSADINNQIALGFLVSDEDLVTRSEKTVFRVRPGDLLLCLLVERECLVEVQLTCLLFLIIVNFPKESLDIV